MTAKRKQLTPSDKAEPEPQNGPCMVALPSDRWRLFVEAFVADPLGHGAQVRAARRAGFGKPNSTPLNLTKIASRLMGDPRITAAIGEASRARWRGAAPKAVEAALKVIGDPSHRDHGRIVAALIDRVDPEITRQQVDVSVTHHDETPLLVLRMLLEQGLSFAQAQSMIGANRPFDLVAEWQRLGGRVIEGEVGEVEREKLEFDALGFASSADSPDTGNSR
jgi:hypothetical protein